MIELQNVSKHYRLSSDAVVKAVDNVTLRVEKGDFMMVVGRSGSGKTTLLSLMAGLTKPSSGQVLLDGVDLWSLKDVEQSRVRAEKIGFVFQIPSLVPTMTVLDNLRLPTMFTQRHGVVGERALDLLALVGLPNEAAVSYPSQLSVGQQKRVALARALMNSPDMLLADEPTSDLDEETEREIMALLQRVHADGPRTVVMVTHNMGLARYGRGLFRMASGQLTELRSAAALSESEVPREAQTIRG